jgi:hypothetical protein
METIIFKAFGTLFRFVGFLLLTGTIVAALSDLQERAFVSHRTGLVSMLKVNQQLVGKTK